MSGQLNSTRKALRTRAGTQCYRNAQKGMSDMETTGPWIFLTQACDLAKQPATPQAPCSTPDNASSWCLWAHSSHLSSHICFRGPSRVDSESPPALRSWCPSKGGSGGSTPVPSALPCTKRSFIPRSLGPTNKPTQRPKLGKVRCKTGLETVVPENIDDCLKPLVSLLPVETGRTHVCCQASQSAHRTPWRPLVAEPGVAL